MFSSALVSLLFCLSDSRITQKLLDEFSRNLVERWHMVTEETV